MDYDFPFFLYVGLFKAFFLTQIVFHILYWHIEQLGIVPYKINRYISSDCI